MNDTFSFLKTIAHPDRFRLVVLLCQHGELNVNDLVELTGFRQPHVSQLLVSIKAAGLVDCRHQGTQRFYTLRETPYVASVVEAVCNIMPQKERRR